MLDKVRPYWIFGVSLKFKSVEIFLIKFKRVIYDGIIEKSRKFFLFDRKIVRKSIELTVGRTSRSTELRATFVCHLCYNFVCQPLITGRVHGALSSPYTPGDQDPHGL